MSILNHNGEQEESILSYKPIKGFFNRKSLKRVLALFLCVAILATLNIAVPTKTEAALKLNVKTGYVFKEHTFKIKLGNVNGTKVTWRVSNPFTGSVSNDGTFTPKGYGMTFVTAKYKNKSYKCKMIVPDTNRSMSLNKKKVTIFETKSFKLKVNATEKIKFHSRNTHIATVTSKGKIKAKNPGKTTIVAKKGGAFATCTVTVKSLGEVNHKTPAWLNDRAKVAIRKYTDKWHPTFGRIIKRKNQTINLGLANVRANTVKKVVWSSSNQTVATVAEKGKITATANLLNVGRTKISAVVFYTSGKNEVLTNNIDVTNPQPNTNVVNCFTKSVGSNRYQYVYFTGLSEYTKVKYKVSNKKCVKVSIYNNKVRLLGKKNGHGTITATVHGKTYKIRYYVVTPKFGSIIGVLVKGNTTKIKIGGIGKIQPVFTSRDTSKCSVALDGTITGRGSGVTYVDVKIGTMTFSYRVEVAATGIKTIIKRAKYIVNNWTYSQGNRMADGYYDCSALVWKGYKAYKNYHAKLGSTKYALPAAYLFDYLRAKGQIAYFGYTKMDDLRPGDLFFYGDYNSAVKYSQPGRTLNIYHVAMYAGNGYVVEKGTPRFTYNSLDHVVGVGRVVY